MRSRHKQLLMNKSQTNCNVLYGGKHMISNTKCTEAKTIGKFSTTLYH